MISNSGLTVNVSDNKQSVLGYNFRELLTPHGVLELVYAPVLRGAYANHMLIVDPDYVELKQFRPFAMKTNIKTDDGYDGVKDEYFSDEGVAIRLVDTSALFKIS